MAQRQRSPFGELVYRYRTGRNLTQAQLAVYIPLVHGSWSGSGYVSARTIASIEQRYRPDQEWSPNHASTVDILAWKFELQPDSPEMREFHDAANATRQTRSAKWSSAAVETEDGTGFIAAGRELPLARLLAAVQNLKHGRPGMLMVGAEAGAGKSRLLAHVCQIAVESIPNLVVLWGTSTEGGRPYQPVVQMLELLVGQADDVPPGGFNTPTNARNIQSRLPTDDQDVPNDDRLLISNILSSPSPANMQPSPKLTRYLSAVGAINAPSTDAHDFAEQMWLSLVRYSQSGPVIVVWENLHHADDGTAGLLQHYLRRLRDTSAPVLILGSYRSFEVDPGNGQVPAPFANLLRDLPHATYDPVIDLNSAIGGVEGRAYVLALVDSRVQDAPHHVAEDVFRLTEGLPLLVEVALQWYVAEGALFTDAGDVLHWKQTPFPLPTEVRTVFDDVLADLGPEPLELLEQASVQGIVFSADVLQGVAGLTRQSLIARLDNLLSRRAHVVQPAVSRTIAGRRTYDYEFHHAMLGEYVYERLEPGNRQALHHRTAEAMLSVWGATAHNGAIHIARQYELAGDPANAAFWYLQAGDYHLFRHEHREAFKHYHHIQQMDATSIDPFVATQSLVGLGNCARGRGDLEAARRELLTARRRAKELDQQLVEANSLTSLAMVEFDAGRLEVGTANLAVAVELLMDLGNILEACRSLALLSHLLHGCGRYDEARARAYQAIELAESMGQESLRIYGFIALTDSLLALGNYEKVNDLMEGALETAIELGDTPRIVLCSLNESHASIELRELGRAKRALDRVFALEQTTNGRMIGAAHFDMGMILAEEHSFQTAREHFETSRQLRRQNHQWALLIDSEAALLRVAMVEGCHAEVTELSSALRTRIERQGADGVEHPARLFVALAQAGSLLEDLDLEDWALRSGRDFLLQRASWLSNEEERTAYLRSVPANLKLLNMAANYAVEHWVDGQAVKSAGIAV